MFRGIRHSTRQHRPREDVERLLGDYDTSDLTQADFARANRVVLSTLRFWLRRRRKQNGGTDAAPALIPVTLRPAIGGNGNRLEIVLTNGRELRLPIDADPRRVAALVAALES